MALDRLYPCAYCGDLASERDHPDPRCRGNLRNKGFRKDNTVPACKDCNARLNDFPFAQLGKRAAYVRARISKKFKKLLAMPVWSEDELDELSPELKQTVLDQIAAKAEVESRVERLFLTEALDPTIEEVWQDLDPEDEI